MSMRCFDLPIDRRCVRNDASLSSKTLATALLLAPLLALMIVQFGCAASKKAQLPEVVGDNPKSAELIQAVNANAAKIKTIYAPSASVGFNNLPNYASCQMVFESPNKFRLRGSVSLVGQVVDSGCDGTDFWFWGRYQNPDELYYCKLSEYTGSALADYMPVDPSWFPEALGVDEIKESDILDEPQTQADGTLLVTLKKERADGTYRKRLYFEPRTAAVARQDVQNPDGDVVVSVVCREQQYVESPGVVLPKRLEITCAKTGETLVVNLGTVTLNEANTISSTAFQRPTDLKARDVDVGAALKKNAVAALTKPAEITRPAEVVRPAETKQEIQKTRAVETNVVAPTVKQTDDSGATWTTVNPSQFSQSSQLSQSSTTPNVVATPAANPNVGASNAPASLNASSPNMSPNMSPSASQTSVVSSFAPGTAAQTAPSQSQPFVLEGSGAALDASNGSYDISQASANPTSGVMVAKPSTTRDPGVEPFPSDLNAQTASTRANATDDFTNAIPLESESLRASTAYVAPPTQETQTIQTTAPTATNSQAAYVADASAQNKVPTGTPIANEPALDSLYEEPAPLDDVLLNEEFPSF